MTLQDIVDGGKVAVARALTQLELKPHDPQTIALLDEAFEAKRGASIGLTGPPGVGKSSLTQALIGAFRQRGRTVAIVAVDPSSKRSGGALLGDRTRIETDPDDNGVFMRSMAARGSLGGLSETAFPAIVLLRAIFDVVVVETVGVGQSEIEVAERTDCVVFCAQPGSGDALQFMKAGVMEIPDIVLITKGDLGDLAQRAAADLRGAFSLDERGESVPVSVVSSSTGAGIDDAATLLLGYAKDSVEGPEGLRKRREQGVSWSHSVIADRYGWEGLSIVKQHLEPESSPFQSTLRAQQHLSSMLAVAKAQ